MLERHVVGFGRYRLIPGHTLESIDRGGPSRALAGGGGKLSGPSTIATVLKSVGTPVTVLAATGAPSPSLVATASAWGFLCGG